MPVTQALRWTAVGFALAHVSGLLLHDPTPYSGTLAMAAIFTAVSSRPAPSRRLLCGLAALTALAWSVDARGGGFGWPTGLAEPATGVRAVVEAALLLGGGVALLGADVGFVVGRVRVGVVALVVLVVAAWPLWGFETPLLLSTQDRTGLLVATLPLLAVVVLGIFAADRALSFAHFSGTGAAGAATLAGLAALAVRYRAGETRFSPAPIVRHLSPPEGDAYQVSIDVYARVTDGPIAVLAPGAREFSTAFSTQVPGPAPVTPPAPTWSDGGFWTAQFSWAEVSTAVLAMICVAAVVAVAMAGQDAEKAGA